MKITSLEPLVVDVGSRNWLFVVVETDEETLARYPETGAVLEVVLDA